MIQDNLPATRLNEYDLGVLVGTLESSMERDSLLLMGEIATFKAQLASLIAELRASRQAIAGGGGGGWKDISSAPKDGTHVDLWVTPHPKNLSGAGGERVSDCWFAYGEWRYHDAFADDGFSSVDNAVQWMPVPASPSPDRGGE